MNRLMANGQEYPGTKNLIPLNKMSPEERRAIQSKGGKTVSMKQKLSYQIREAKKTGLNKDRITKMLLLMANSECSAFDVLKGIETLENCLAPEQQDRVIELKMKWHKLHHGDKSAASVNINTGSDAKIQINIIEYGEHKNRLGSVDETTDSVQDTDRQDND